MSEFYPTLRYVSGITNSQQAVITFTEDHQFTVGEIVSVRSSRPYGMWEINNLSSRVVDTTSNTITIEIDSTNFTPFVYPPSGTVSFLSVVVPSGSGIIPGEYVPTVSLIDRFDHLP